MVAASADHMESGAERTYHHLDFPLSRLLAAKGATTVSACLPARNESGTIARIVGTLRADLLDTGVIDELIVIDDHSTDDTAELARAAGARVIASEDILPEYGEGHGKGEVLWKSLLVSTGDIVLWCDTDLRDFHHRFISGLLGPLLVDPDVAFVKGYYQRPEANGEGGGRVTELVARPLVALLFPELVPIRQPLSGEYGGRREILEQLPFVEGYGVEMGLLIDIARLAGADAMAQVDLEVRHHRNRPLAELGPQAMAIMQTVLRRVDRDLAPVAASFPVPGGATAEVEAAERPPMLEVAEYLQHRATLTAPATT
jgi:glucosyl-3-phosphoglycerate synthase